MHLTKIVKNSSSCCRFYCIAHVSRDVTMGVTGFKYSFWSMVYSDESDDHVIYKIYKYAYMFK